MSRGAGRKILICVLGLVAATFAVWADDTSSLSVPVSVRYGDLYRY